MPPKKKPRFDHSGRLGAKTVKILCVPVLNADYRLELSLTKSHAKAKADVTTTGII